MEEIARQNQVDLEQAERMLKEREEAERVRQEAEAARLRLVQQSLEEEAARREAQSAAQRKAAKLVSPAGRGLLECLHAHPGIARNSHEMHEWVLECRQSIMEGDEEQALDIVKRIERWVETETAVIRAAFAMFDCLGKGRLSPNEVQSMLEYLGFPSTEADVQKLLDFIDSDKDGEMSLREFQVYVDRTGGLNRLYEMRRRELKRGSSEYRGLEGVADREDMLAAGVLDSAQNMWRLVVPEAELLEVAKLVDCQRQALRHIRQIAASNHEAALPNLLERVRGLGFQDEALWTTFAFVREKAPIIVHIKLDTMMPIFEKDTHYRTCFETGTGADGKNQKARACWEKKLFGGAYENCKPFDRPKYGVMNIVNDYRGIQACLSYGESYLVMKGVRLRVTSSPGDSCSCNADRLSVLDYYAHILSECSSSQLKYIIEVANGLKITEDSRTGTFKEIQIHGEVLFAKHVDRLVAHETHRKHEKRIKKLCKKHGWKLCWMDKDREQLMSWVTPQNKERHDANALLEHISMCDAVGDQAAAVSITVVHPKRGELVVEYGNITPLGLLMETFSNRIGHPVNQLRFFFGDFCVLPGDTLKKLDCPECHIIIVEDVEEEEQEEVTEETVA